MSEAQEGLNRFERALASLEPARSGLARDRLMYEAGRRSAMREARRSWAWPALAASLACVCLTQAFLTVRVVDRAPTGRVPSEPSTAPLGPVEILLQREPLPTPAPSSGPPAAAEDSVRRLARRMAREELDPLVPPGNILSTSVRVAPLDGRTPEILSPLRALRESFDTLSGEPL